MLTNQNVIAPELHVMSPDCATMLGSPLYSIESISDIIHEKINLLKVMGDRVQYLHAHDAHPSATTLLYHSKTAICNSYCSYPNVKEYDVVLLSIVRTIANDHFKEKDPAWTQANLPFNVSGLGFRSAVQLVTVYLFTLCCLFR